MQSVEPEAFGQRQVEAGQDLGLSSVGAADAAQAVAPTDSNHALFGMNSGYIIRTTRALSLNSINPLSTTLDRLTRPHASGRFQPRELPGRDAAAFVQRSLSSRPTRYEARLTLHASAEEMATRVPRWAGPFEPLGEDRCEYRTGDDNLEWLAARLAMLGVEFEVHEPPELAEQLRALAARLERAAAPLER